MTGNSKPDLSRQRAGCEGVRLACKSRPNGPGSRKPNEARALLGLLVGDAGSSTVKRTGASPRSERVLRAG